MKVTPPPLNPSVRVSAHYDSLASSRPLNKHEREQLDTYPLRAFNNMVKRHTIEQLKLRENCVLMDVCCGRGGDLFKYACLRPSHVVFVDISRTSIAEAKRRYEQAYAKHKVEYTASFIVCDCFAAAASSTDTHLREELHKLGAPTFDAIFCHFAIHYAFASSEWVHTFFDTVSSHLVHNGYVSLIHPSCARILDKSHNGTRSFGNSVYQVQFAADEDVNHTTQFGRKYTFTLDGSVHQCDEYLIDRATLHRVANQRQLYACKDVGSMEYAKLCNIPAPHDEQLRDVCSLYHVTVFVNHRNQVLERNWVDALTERCNKVSTCSVPVFSYVYTNEEHTIGRCVVVAHTAEHTLSAASDLSTNLAYAKQQAAYRLMAQSVPVYLDTTTHNEVEDRARTYDQMCPTPLDLADRTLRPCHLDTAECIVHVDTSRTTLVAADIVECARVYPSCFFICYIAYCDLSVPPYTFLREIHITQLPANVILCRATWPSASSNSTIFESLLLPQVAIYSVNRARVHQLVVASESSSCSNNLSCLVRNRRDHLCGGGKIEAISHWCHVHEHLDTLGTQ